MFHDFNHAMFANMPPGFNATHSPSGPWPMFSGVPGLIQMQNAFMVMALRTQIDTLRFWDSMLEGAESPTPPDVNPLVAPMIQAWKNSVTQHQSQVVKQRELIAGSIEMLEKLLKTWETNWSPKTAKPGPNDPPAPNEQQDAESK